MKLKERKRSQNFC